MQNKSNMNMDTQNNILLSIKNLSVGFYTDEGEIVAVNDVSYDIERGKTLAVVGESGCGKSVTAMTAMKLIPSPPGRILGGSIKFKGVEITTAGEKQMRKLRGNEIAMIFQEPMTSLNPVYTIGEQIAEAIELHQNLKGDQAWTKAVEMLDKVGIAEPAKRAWDYPHQMSGGMRQRVMIAMAISCEPALLIADEPTTALDVTIQAQILELLRELQEHNNMSILLITHDLGVVAENAHDVVVMYASKIVEKADVNSLFTKPMHPYTMGLLRSLPKLDEESTRLQTIPGTVPNPANFPAGCKFHPRCPHCMDICRSQEPQLIEIEPGRHTACWLYCK
jgi:oligopeptide/dipeptide ABC transporter ATP-binding protein